MDHAFFVTNRLGVRVMTKIICLLLPLTMSISHAAHSLDAYSNPAENRLSGIRQGGQNAARNITDRAHSS